MSNYNHRYQHDGPNPVPFEGEPRRTRISVSAADPGVLYFFFSTSRERLITGTTPFTDPLASGREVILLDNEGVGRSSGEAQQMIAGMAEHVLAFLDGLGLESCDVLGFSLGEMVAQQILFAATKTSQ